MEIEIDEKIVTKAKACIKNFDCLNNDMHIYCKVEYCCNNKVHFIKCLDNQYCSFQKSFGFAFMCTCPLRKEIYNKYGI